MIELKFVAATRSGLHDAIRDYLGLDAEPAPQTDAAAPAAATTRQAKKASAGAASAASAATTSSITAEEAAPELTYDGDIKPLILKVSKERGEDIARGMLGQFKGADGKACAGGKAIQVKDYASFVNVANKLLAEGPEAEELT